MTTFKWHPIRLLSPVALLLLAVMVGCGGGGGGSAPGGVAAPPVAVPQNGVGGRMALTLPARVPVGGRSAAKVPAGSAQAQVVLVGTSSTSTSTGGDSHSHPYSVDETFELGDTPREVILGNIPEGGYTLTLYLKSAENTILASRTLPVYIEAAVVNRTEAVMGMSLQGSSVLPQGLSFEAGEMMVLDYFGSPAIVGLGACQSTLAGDGFIACLPSGSSYAVTKDGQTLAQGSVTGSAQSGQGLAVFRSRVLPGQLLDVVAFPGESSLTLDWGDGQSGAATSGRHSHAYTTPGNYSVRLMNDSSVVAKAQVAVMATDSSNTEAYARPGARLALSGAGVAAATAGRLLVSAESVPTRDASSQSGLVLALENAVNVSEGIAILTSTSPTIASCDGQVLKASKAIATTTQYLCVVQEGVTYLLQVTSFFGPIIGATDGIPGEVGLRVMANSQGANPGQNSAPVFTSSLTASSTLQGQFFSHTFETSDSDGDVVMVTLSGDVPTGLSFTGNTLSGVPSVSGSFSFTLTATDGIEEATLGFTLTVINEPPTLSVAPTATAVVSESFSLSFTTSDANGESVIVTSEGALPPGLTLQSNAVAGTPSQQGSFSIVLAASDGTYTVTQGVVLTVGPNQPPSFTSTPVTSAVVGLGYTYQLSATDPDSTGLTFSVLSGSLPTGVTLSGATVSGTPTQQGSFQVDLGVSDNVNPAVSQSITISVGPNQPPTFSETQPPATAVKGTATSFTIQANDPEQQGLTFTVSGLPAGLSLTNGSGQASIGGTPTANAGSYTYSVTVQDGVNTVSASYTITITDPPPTFSSAASAQAVQGLPFSHSIVVTDPLGDTITLNQTGAPTGITLNTEASPPRLEGTTTDETGNVTITITANDGINTVTQSFTLTIAANQAPVFSSAASAQAVRGVSFSHTVMVSDPENQTVTLTQTGAPTGITLNTGVSPPRLEGTTTAQADGYTISIVAADGVKTTTQSFTLTVAENQAPAFTSGTSGQAVRGLAFTHDVTVTDAEGDAVTLSQTGAPTGITLNTGVSPPRLEGTTTVAAGTYPISIVAATALNTTTQSFTLTVAENQAPSFTSSAPPSGMKDQFYTHTFAATDPESQAVTFTVVSGSLPAGLTLTSGNLSGTPTQAGSFPFTVSASDGVSSAVQNVTLVITQNQAPVVALTQSLSISASQAATLNLNISDPEQDPITIILASGELPATCAINSPVGVECTSPPEGFTSFVLTVSDGTNMVNVTVNLDVGGMNDPPVYTGPTTFNATVGQAFNQTFTATDPENDPIDYLFGGTLPPGLNSMLGGVISGTPTTAGTYPMFMTFSDPYNPNVVVNFTITVSAVAPRSSAWIREEDN